MEEVFEKQSAKYDGLVSEGQRRGWKTLCDSIEVAEASKVSLSTGHLSGWELEDCTVEGT